MHPQHPQSWPPWAVVLCWGEERVVSISSQSWWSWRQKHTGRSGCTLLRHMSQPLAHGTYVFGVHNVQHSLAHGELEGQEMLNWLGHGRLLCYIVREATEEGQMAHSVRESVFPSYHPFTSIYAFIYPCIHPSMHQCVHPCICASSMHWCVHPCIDVSIHAFMHPSIHFWSTMLNPGCALRWDSEWSYFCLQEDCLTWDHGCLLSPYSNTSGMGIRMYASLGWGSLELADRTLSWQRLC